MPSNSIVIRVRAIDRYNQLSGYLTGTFTNPAPATPGGLTSTPWMNGIEFNWDENTENDVLNGGYYLYRYQIESEGWIGWKKVSTPERVLILLDETQSDTYKPGATVYFEVKAVDTFGTESGVASDNDTTGSLTIPSTALTDFEQISGAFYEVPVLRDFTWADDDPSAGSISWTSGTIYYNGNTYTIASGSTSNHYVVYSPDIGYTGVFFGIDDTSSIPEGSFIIAVNNSGATALVWNNAVANQVIGSAWIRNAAIVTAKIDDLAVTNAKINDLDGAKITAGTLLVTGMSTSMQEAALNSYNVQSGNLIANSDFAAGLDQWTTNDGGLTDITFGTDISVDYTLYRGHTAYILQPGVYEGGTEWAIIQQDIPVEAGKRYCVSAYTGAISCTVRIYCTFHNSNDSFLSDFTSTLNENESAGGKILENYERIYGFGTAPATAAYVRIHFMKGDTYSPPATYYNSLGLFSNVMFSEVGEDQTEPPPYSISVPAGADITSENTANNTSNVGAVTASNVAGWAYSGNNTYINGGNIYTNTITATQIAALTITAAEIASNTITAAQIAAGTLTASQINGAGFGNLTISSGTITIQTAAGLTISGSGTVEVAAGNSIVLTGHDSNPGVIKFEGSTYSTRLRCFGSGAGFQVSPDASSGQSFLIGSPTLSTNNFGTVSICAENGPVGIYSFYDSNNSGRVYVSAASNGGIIYLYSKSSGTEKGVQLVNIPGVLTFRPLSDGAIYLGDSTYKWHSVWASNGTIQTSDERFKEEIKPLPLGLGFINKINAISFKQLGVSNDQRKMGFSAQEIEDILYADYGGEEFGGIYYDEQNDTYGINYGEFIPVVFKAIQELTQQIEELKGE